MVPAVAGRVLLQVDRLATAGRLTRDNRFFKRQREQNVAGPSIGA